MFGFFKKALKKVGVQPKKRMATIVQDEPLQQFPEFKETL